MTQLVTHHLEGQCITADAQLLIASLVSQRINGDTRKGGYVLASMTWMCVYLWAFDKQGEQGKEGRDCQALQYFL